MYVIDWDGVSPMSICETRERAMYEIIIRYFNEMLPDIIDTVEGKLSTLNEKEAEDALATLYGISTDIETLKRDGYIESFAYLCDGEVLK